MHRPSTVWSGIASESTDGKVRALGGSGELLASSFAAAGDRGHRAPRFARGWYGGRCPRFLRFPFFVGLVQERNQLETHFGRVI